MPERPTPRIVTYTPLPSPNYEDDHLEYLGRWSGRKRWRDPNSNNLYEYDSRHCELEVYNRRGRHLGVADVVTGEIIKPAQRGRKIDV